MTIPVYQLRAVRKGFGTSFELVIDRLDVLPGEVLCLLGPTGAGKSTLLRLLAGLETPSGGQVQFSGTNVTSQDVPLSVLRRIAMVHQRPHLLTGSVGYNVHYGLRIRKTVDGAARVETILNRLGLQSRESQAVHGLSGGQAQLVALARAIVLEPEVLLLDEPTSNLDPARVGMVEELVREIQQTRHMTVVWATHNLFQARRVGSRIGLLWDGKIIEVADQDRFFQSPTDPRTADFIQGKLVF